MSLSFCGIQGWERNASKAIGLLDAVTAPPLEPGTGLRLLWKVQRRTGRQGKRPRASATSPESQPSEDTSASRLAKPEGRQFKHWLYVQAEFRGHGHEHEPRGPMGDRGWKDRSVEGGRGKWEDGRGGKSHGAPDLA